MQIQRAEQEPVGLTPVDVELCNSLPRKNVQGPQLPFHQTYAVIFCYGN